MNLIQKSNMDIMCKFIKYNIEFCNTPDVLQIWKFVPLLIRRTSSTRENKFLREIDFTELHHLKFCQNARVDISHIQAFSGA